MRQQVVGESQYVGHQLRADSMRGEPAVTAAIRSCQRGDIEGLRVLYELHSEKVFRTCLRILGNRWLAEEAAQDVFLRMFEQIRQFRMRSSFSTWLYRLTVNHTLNLLHQHRRQARLSTSDTPGDCPAEPEQSFLAKEKRHQLCEALSDVPLEQRTILVLREIEELSYREISQVLGIPTGTVMSRLFRARQELKRRWETHRQRWNSSHSPHVENRREGAKR